MRKQGEKYTVIVIHSSVLCKPHAWISTFPNATIPEFPTSWNSNPIGTSKALENSNGGAKVVPIVHLRHHALLIYGDHVGAGLGAQAPDIDVRGAFDSDHVLLTGFGREARLIVIVEEGVESMCKEGMLVNYGMKDEEEKIIPSAIDENVGGLKDAEPPRFPT